MWARALHARNKIKESSRGPFECQFERPARATRNYAPNDPALPNDAKQVRVKVEFERQIDSQLERLLERQIDANSMRFLELFLFDEYKAC